MLLYSAFEVKQLSDYPPVHTEVTFPGCGAILSVVACGVCVDMWRLNPADSHTLTSLLSQYWFLLQLRLKAPSVRRLIEERTIDPRKVTALTL